jgi:hypothetical protein
MSDKIMDKYTDLSLCSVIPSMSEYAEQWDKLALEAYADGRLSTAETCKKRAAHYRALAGGEYIRLNEKNFSELIPVEAKA